MRLIKQDTWYSNSAGDWLNKIHDKQDTWYSNSAGDWLNKIHDIVIQ